MNNRLILNLIHRLRARQQKGFALPMAMMCGMVVLVVAAAMLMRGQEDQNKVISQKAKTTSMAAAEAGLARVQELFAKNKFAALYNGTDWASAISPDGSPVTESGGTPNPVGQALNAQVTAAAGGTDACGNASGTEVETKTTEIKTQLVKLRTLATASSTTFQPLDGKNFYRLVSYKYAGEAGKIPQGQAVGRLVIEGKSTEGGSEAVSRIMVDIPISGSPGSSGGVLPGGSIVPGLWVKEGGVANGADKDVSLNFGNQSYAANVVFSDCGTTKGVISQTYLDTLNASTNMEGTYTAEKNSSVAMPSIPAKPTISATNTFSSGIAKNSNVTLPRTTGGTPDVAVDGVYYYQVNGDIEAKTLTIAPGNKVVIYLNGNIAKGVDIVHDCTGVSGCDPTDFRIYGEKASGGELCMNGNNKTSAFILAPTYAAGSTGGANFSGSLWVKSWGKLSDCSASGNHTAVTQTQNWTDIPNELKPTAGSGPATTLASFSGWSQIGTDVDVASIPAPPTYAGSYLSASGNSAGDGTKDDGTKDEEKKCTMPNLVGTSTTGQTAATLLEAVKAALTGFTGTPTGTVTTSGTDTIQGQNPAATTLVDCGTPVTFTYKLPTLTCSMTASAVSNTKKNTKVSITVTYTNANNSKITATSDNTNATINTSPQTVNGNGEVKFEFTYVNAAPRSGKIKFSGCGSDVSTNFTTTNS